jgi:TPR repeat protein
VLQGVAYLYGFGVRRDARIAAKWFELSGLPEGMMALAVQVSATNPQCAQQARDRRALSALRFHRDARAALEPIARRTRVSGRPLEARPP